MRVAVGLVVAACSGDSGNEARVDGGATDAGASGGGSSAGASSAGASGAGSGGRSNGGASGASSGGVSAGGAGSSNGGAGAGGMGAGGRAAFDGGSNPDASAGEASTSMDAAGAGDAADGASRGQDADHPKRIFITHDRWDGNVLLAANALGINVTTGIAAADALCDRSAVDAGIGGSWVAWISDSAHDAIQRVGDVGPWYRVDGAEVFPDKAALTGNPLIAIDLDETGANTESFDGGGLAAIPWTGTLANGTRSAGTCNDWASNSDGAHGMAGANTATTNAKWSEFTLPLCNRPYHLYCFEQ